MDGLVATREGTTRLSTDEELLERVMRPYRSKNCVYLKEAVIDVGGTPPDARRAVATCRFEIPESCYIDDTGHFNSVEFNICYNQMAYYLIAKSVKERLMQPFAEWTLDDFWQRQLGDILITGFKSSFRTAMRGKSFHGEIELLDADSWDGNDLRDPLLVVRSRCRYWDAYGGDCHGEIDVAITNPPVLTRS